MQKNWAPSNVFHTLYKQIIYRQRCLKDCKDFEEVANIWQIFCRKVTRLTICFYVSDKYL